MNDTIKAKNGGYRVVKVRNVLTGKTGYRIDDGSQPLFVAEKVDFDEFEWNRDGNECFALCEVFTDRDGGQWIYWRDEEVDADYITPVPSQNKMRPRRCAHE
jgi:hypothetical protein